MMVTQIKESSVSLDIVLSTFFILAIVQAVSVNLLKIAFPITQFLLLIMPVAIFLGRGKIKKAILLVVFLAFLCFLALASTYFFLGGSSDEYFYQSYAVLLFVAFGLFFSKFSLLVDMNRSLPILRLALVSYLIFSSVIHLYFWEEIAGIFYGRDNNYGGLLMDGRVPRMYGLFFNPLSSSFSALILFLILYVVNIRDKFLYVLLALIVLFSFSRSAIFLLGITFFYMVLVGSRWAVFIPIFILSLVIIVFFLFFGDSFLSGFIDVVMKDETGSIREHILNYKIGFSYVARLYGEGFVDASGYGAWNTRLESMPLQFAFAGGGLVFLLLVLPIAFCLFFLIARFGLIRSAPVFVLLPLLFSFPLHTFNLPIFLAIFLLCLWMPNIEQVKQGALSSVS